jgi:HK97 family phage major capsid protein
MSKIKTLREQHRTLCASARSLLDDASFTGDKNAEFDKRMAEADGLAKQIDQLQALDDAEKRFEERMQEKADKTGKSKDETRDGEVTYRQAFDRYVRFGAEGLSAEQREVMAQHRSNPIDGQSESRAQSVTGGSPVGIYGGYTVEDEYLRELERALLQFDSVQSEARILNTATGATLTAPFGDDTSNAGAILGENVEIGEQDTTFSQWTIGSYTYTSKLIKISWQLLQDSAFNLEAYLAEIAGERLGRILNTHFTTGTGSGQPQGVVTGSTAGATATGSSVIGYDDLINLEHSVPRAYRTAQAAFMFNDTTLKALRKLKDADGRPIWQPSLQEGVASSLNGRRYIINDDMASPAAAAKPILFGDFKHYIVRKVKDYTLVALRERYAERLQTGFFVYARFDGKVKDAGKGPIRHLVMKATSP